MSEFNGVTENLTYGTINASDVRELAEQHPDFLGALAIPEIHTAQLPPFYLSVWQLLTGYAKELKPVVKYFALGLPRGFGKTTLVKLLLLWVILFTHRRFILIVAETLDKAQNIMSDIFDSLAEPNIKAAFGDWGVGKEQDTLKLKKFSFRGRPIVVACLGVQGSVRGLNIKNVRPDVILMDDIQSREAADSPIESRKIEQWVQGTLLKAKANTGALILFIGNMYPTKNSLLRKFRDNPGWEKIIAGGLLLTQSGVESLWEAVRSLESLIQEYQLDKAAGQEEIFFAEILNDDTATINGLVDLSAIPSCPVSDDEPPQGSFVVIDPATGKSNLDQVAIGYFQVHDARSILWDLEADSLAPMATVQKTLGFCSKYGCRLIFVESVAYQATLAYWFRYFMDKLGINGIQVIEIYPGGGSKTARILTMFKQLTGAGSEYSAPEIFLHSRVRSRVIDQVGSFDFLRTNNRDDILDVLTYAPKILTKYIEVLRANVPLEMLANPVVSSLNYSTAQNSAF